MLRTENAPTAHYIAPRPGDGRRPRGRIHTTRLLTPAEEFDLVTHLCKYRERITKHLQPLLTAAPPETKLDHFDQIAVFYLAHKEAVRKPVARQVDALLEKYSEIKHQLVLANLPWVTKLARSQRQSNINEDDLFQEGVCGLLKAIDRFEAARGLRLMTYATWYIREAMQQIRARQSHLVAISSHDQTLLGQLEARQSQFQHEHTRLPNSRELGDGLRGNPRFLNRLQMATRPAISLERSGTEGTIPIPVDDPIPEFDRREQVNTAIGKLLETLPFRERTIVARRFGLCGTEPASLETLGDEFKVSKERVRQLQRQAIKRMQKYATEAQLDVLANM